MDNHGGLTPLALALHDCASAGDFRLPLHARYPATGGLRPPLLVVGRMSLNGARFIRHAVRVTQPRGLTPPLLCGTNANLEVVCRKCRRCHRGERRPWWTIAGRVPQKLRSSHLCTKKRAFAVSNCRACSAGYAPYTQTDVHLRASTLCNDGMPRTQKPAPGPSHHS